MGDCVRCGHPGCDTYKVTLYIPPSTSPPVHTSTLMHAHRQYPEALDALMVAKEAPQPSPAGGDSMDAVGGGRRAGGDGDGGSSGPSTAAAGSSGRVSAVDMAVYSRMRHFRMVWSCKGGKTAVLQPTHRCGGDSV